MHRRVLLHPARVLLLVLALTLIPASALPQLELRTDGAALHPTGNPIVEATREDRGLFHDPEQVILLLSSRDDGPALESAAGFRTVRRLHYSVGKLPAVERRRVRSLFSVLDPPPDLKSLAIRPFLSHVPAGPAEFEALVDRIRTQEVAGGLYLSEDGRTAAFYLPLAQGHGREELISQLRAWVAEQNEIDFDLRLTGPVMAEVLLGRRVLHDLARLTPFMMLVVAALLFVVLASPGGVVIPLVEVMMVLTWTLGAMAWCGVPVTLVTTILPAVLTALAVTDEIHLLERYQAHLVAGAGAGRCDRQRAMASALDDVGWPIAVTSLSTALGFLSFLTAAMAPVRHFGVFAALGIVLAMILSFTFIPALAVVLPAAWFRPRRRGRESLPRYEAILLRYRHRGWRLAGLLVVLAMPGLFRLTVQDSWIDNFDPATDLVSAERDFNAHFWGSYRFDVVLTSPGLLYFHQPEGIRVVEEVVALARAGPRVGGVTSHLIPFGIIAGTMGKEGPLSSLSPRTLTRIAALSTFIRSRVDLDHYVLPGARKVRVRLFVNSPDYRQTAALEEHLNRGLPPLLADREASYSLSGDLPVALEVVRAVVGNQLRSLAAALGAVGVLLALVLGSVRAAGILLSPLAVTLVMLLGGMGYAGLPLGIASSMFAALAVGVGIDFALHFAHAYRRQRAPGRKGEHSCEQAMLATLASAGRAIRWNALVLSLGFLVLTFSTLKPNHSLGWLLAAAMAVSYGATLLLLPSLLEWLDSRENLG